MRRTIVARYSDDEGTVQEQTHVSSDPHTLAGFVASITDERPGTEVTFIAKSERDDDAR